MISQILFGERAEQLGKKVGFRRIRCLSDDTIGWVCDRQLTRLKKDVKTSHIVGDISSTVFADGLSTYVTLGAELPAYDGMTARIDGDKYRYSGAALDPSRRQPDFTLADKLAHRLLNAPYLAGGRTPFGIDADGYVQLIYRCMGVQLPRRMADQIQLGENIDFVNTAQPGDLAFFKNENSNVCHVGMIIGEGQVIHAHGRVRIDRIDHQGIYDKRRRKYTHTLRTVRRVL